MVAMFLSFGGKIIPKGNGTRGSPFRSQHEFTSLVTYENSRDQTTLRAPHGQPRPKLTCKERPRHRFGLGADDTMSGSPRVTRIMRVPLARLIPREDGHVVFDILGEQAILQTHLSDQSQTRVHEDASALAPARNSGVRIHRRLPRSGLIFRPRSRFRAEPLSRGFGLVYYTISRC